MPDGNDDPQAFGQTCADRQDGVALRILATTDLHMKLLPHDYLSGLPCDRGSLAQAASLIERHRLSAPNVLLVDNGDFLQGTPLGDQAALNARRHHPAIAAMNLMGYDAAAIGNHDFAFGIDLLQAVARQARFPLLAANLRVKGKTDFLKYVILDRRVRTDRGQPADLRIGVIGFMPPQTTAWDSDLGRHMACDDILLTARRLVPQIRAEGADLVIALAHSGISHRPWTPGAENVAAELALVDGIDAIVAGHTHQVFPGGGLASAPGIDAVAGTLEGKPAVMPGFGGSHLGVIDLRLERGLRQEWRLAGAAARCEAVMSLDVPVAPAIVKAVAPTHRRTVSQLNTAVARSNRRISSHFALAGMDPVSALVNMAQRWHVRKSLRGTALEGMPVLSAAAPFRAGGRSGPLHYTDLAPGRLTQASLADIYPFPNRICALVLSGAELLGWLERSVSLFNRIVPGQQDQMLVDPRFPAYQFDVIQGLRWQVDLSQPAAFRTDGTATGASRVRDAMWRGRPLADDDLFVLATNSFRLASHGLFSTLASARECALPVGPRAPEVIRNYLRRRRRIDIDPAPSWHFAPMPGTTVIFHTSPAGLSLLPGLARDSGRRMEDAGRTEDGFARVRLHL